ncbi:MAG: tRNA (adenosine(37)-N6)-dimethylallyltransferase MiaA [Flexilinea sp.]|nr:tRNA (adenosine(37)-N6)-dimethylallyltransferase MiaA [Flexilinea sp.]
MSQQMTKIPVIFIVGPTASGKTDAGIRLAKMTGGEIVSADSRYLYRGMDIGTAKPTLEERQGIPHWLIDVADPDETWSLSLFQKAADEAIRDIHSRGKLPILVGGTGQYVRAILEGWSIPEGEPDHRLRTILEDWGKEIGAEELYRKLALLDPEAAAKIEWQNMRRTIRALEVILTTGKKFSEQRTVKESPYDAVIFGMKRGRAELYERIDLRVDLMIRNGLVEETAALLEKGYSEALPSMSAIGYKEICDYLHGKTNLEEAAQLIKFRTHNYVRRQANWFKPNDPQIRWIDPDAIGSAAAELFKEGC